MNHDLEKTDFSDITIIIPTHNRHFLLEKLLKYYSKTNINLIIMDSSKDIFNFKKSKKIKYFYCPNLTYNKKMFIGVNKITTKYATLCADDDFFSMHALFVGLKFLENNDEYGSVQGNSIMFYKYLSFFIFYKENNIHLNEFSRDNNILKERVFDKFKQQNLLYSLTKTSILLEICNIVKNFREVSLFEPTDSIVKSVISKQKTLNIFWNARDIRRYSSYTSNNNESETLVIEDFSEFIKTKNGIKYIKELVKFYNKFKDKDDISVNEFEKLLFKNFNTKIKHKYKDLQNKLHHRYKIFEIRFFFYSIIFKFTQNKKYDYPYSSLTAKNEWQKIKKIIFLK